MFRFAILIACLCVAPGFVAAEINTSEISVEPVRAFPELLVRRPVVIGHAGDGSNRLFVCTQQGVVHILDPADSSATETVKFLDIEDKVVYHDRKNEEGLLGMAFHPKFKESVSLDKFVHLLQARADKLGAFKRVLEIRNSELNKSKTSAWVDAVLEYTDHKTIGKFSFGKIDNKWRLKYFKVLSPDPGAVE